MTAAEQLIEEIRHCDPPWMVSGTGEVGISPRDGWFFIACPSGLHSRDIQRDSPAEQVEMYRIWVRACECCREV